MDMHPSFNADQYNTPQSPEQSGVAQTYHQTRQTAPHTMPGQPPATSATSTYSVEYVMMTIALWVGALTLAGISLPLVDGIGISSLTFPVATLVVAVGLFSLLFVRLKKAELRNPGLRSSRRQMDQLTQIFAYIACFGSIVGLVYSVLAEFGGSFSGPLGKYILNCLIVLVIAAALLAYARLSDKVSHR
jgi:FtsH-binding integral membrane protein